MKDTLSTSSSWTYISQCEPSPDKRALFVSSNNIYIVGGKPHFFMKYSQNSQKWVNLTAHLPFRSNFLLLPFGDSFYLYGGLTEEQAFDDLWKYQPAKGWRQVLAQNIGARGNCAGLAIESQSKFFIFGGTNPFSGDTPFEDMHLFQTYKESWYVVSFMGERFLNRLGFTANAVQDRILIFGGVSSSGYSKDLYEVRVTGLHAVADRINAEGPEPRAGHGSIVVDNRYLLLYGGHSGERLLGDKWFYDTVKKVWYKIDNSGSLLGQRTQFSIFKQGKQIYFFGGRTSEGLSSDLHREDIYDLYSLPQSGSRARPFQNYLKGVAQYMTPFQAIGLLLDCLSLTKSSFANIRLVLLPDQPEKDLKRRLSIQFDGCCMDPKEFNKNCKLLSSGTMPFQEDRFKQFSTLMKLGSLRLGSSFLYLEKCQNYLKVLFFLAGKSFHELDFLCLFYIETLKEGESCEYWFDPEKADRKFEKSNLQQQQKRLLLQYLRAQDLKTQLGLKHSFKQGKFLHIMGLAQSSDKQFELRSFQGEIVCESGQSLRNLARSGVAWRQSLDICLRAYLSHYSCADGSLPKVYFSTGLELQQIKPVSYSDQDRTSEDRGIRLPTIENAYIDCAYLFRDPKPKRLRNGILLYYDNRLVSRFGAPMGMSLDLQQATGQNTQVYGAVILNKRSNPNIIKTDLEKASARYYVQRTLIEYLRANGIE